MADNKILIINGFSMYTQNSTGITMRSIVDFFNPQDVLEVYYYSLEDNESLAEKEIESLRLEPETKPVYNLVRKFYKGGLKGSINRKITESEIKEKGSLLKNIKKYLLALDDFLSPRFEKNIHILNRVKEFKPDIIYTLGASIFTLSVCEYFSNCYNIPIVLHHMDNWRETTYSESFILKGARSKIVKKLEVVESRMHFGMTISDEMAREYKKISGKEYISLMNTVSDIKPFSAKNTELDTLRIVYTGGLHLERWKMLVQLQEALSSCVDEKRNMRIYIYTTQKDRERYNKTFSDQLVTFSDYLPHDQVRTAYSQADILIHVESFAPQIIRFTKYSLSTKIPEYMASGRPIICYAPEEIASAKYISATRSGRSVSSFTELCSALRELIMSQQLREELGRNGVEAARLKHSEDYKNSVMIKVFEIDNYNNINSKERHGCLTS